MLDNVKTIQKIYFCTLFFKVELQKLWENNDKNKLYTDKKWILNRFFIFYKYWQFGIYFTDTFYIFTDRKILNHIKLIRFIVSLSLSLSSHFSSHTRCHCSSRPISHQPRQIGCFLRTKSIISFYLINCNI
jgi:hypothetical protein